MSTKRALLIDSGVWVASRDDEDQYHGVARELIHEADVSLMALDLTLYEVANTVVRRWKDSEWAAVACRSVFRRCDQRLVEIDMDLICSTAEFAVEYHLTSYDAAYVAVARRHDWTLVSTDIRDLVSQGLAITPDAAV
jgi:predicted nucleic acid-binding protein